MYKLPVFATLRAGYGFVWQQRIDLVAYAFLPVLLAAITQIFVATTGIGRVAIFYSFSELGGELISLFNSYSLFASGGLPAVVAAIIAIIVQYSLYLVFSAAWYRHNLIGRAPQPLIEPFERRSYQLRYIAYAVVVTALYVIAQSVVLIGLFFSYRGAIDFMGALIRAYEINSLATYFEAWDIKHNPFVFFLVYLSDFVAAIVTARFWLILPASAVSDTRLTLRVSRKISKHNSWRILLVVLLGYTIPLLAILGLYAGLVTTGSLFSALKSSVALLFLAALIEQAIIFIFFATGVSLLSVMYRQFVDNVAVPGDLKSA